MILGPWTHGGITNNPVGHDQRASRSKFDQIGYIVPFMEGALQCESRVKDAIGNPALSNGNALAPSGSHLETAALEKGMGNSEGDRSFASSRLSGQRCNGTSSLSQALSEGILEAATESLVPTTIPTSPFTDDQGEPLLLHPISLAP